ncbi:MAG: C-GCAxxG-C-C family protein [Bacteroidia bacterium]|nr:C-GCAxxG-C-C family protein [Bacteroidia bacterium]
MTIKKTSRRKFISSASALALGSAAFGLNIPAETKKKKSKEEVYKQLDELVDKYLPVFGACSQTSFYALNKTFNLKADIIVKALASFPGIAMRGETCGAVSGSLMGVALVYEGDKYDEKGAKKLSLGPSEKFCSEFENEFSTTRCRDVIKHNTGKEYVLTKKADYQAVSRDGGFKHCSGVIKKAVHYAADIIMEKS